VVFIPHFQGDGPAAGSDESVLLLKIPLNPFDVEVGT